VFRNRLDVGVVLIRSDVNALNAAFAAGVTNFVGGAGGAATRSSAGAASFLPDDFGEDGLPGVTVNGGSAVTDSDLAFAAGAENGKPEHDDNANTNTTATDTGRRTRDFGRKKDTLNSHQAHTQPDTPTGPMPS
jgi:hypothetical protein